MSKRTSIGTWAFLFNQKEPIGFEDVVVGSARTGASTAWNWAGSGSIPIPICVKTADERAAVRDLWESRGMGCSGLAADLWAERLITAPDNQSYLATFRKNLKFCTRSGHRGDPRGHHRRSLGAGGRAWRDAPGESHAAGGVRHRAQACLHDLATVRQEAADAGVRVVWEFEPGFAFNKPSDILRVIDGVNHDNFYIMFDTCHADNVAVHGQRQPGKKETLPGGIRELAERLKGKIGRLHSDRFRRHDQRTHDQHASAVRRGHAEFRRVHAGHRRCRACRTTGGPSTCASGPMPGTPPPSARRPWMT